MSANELLWKKFRETGNEQAREELILGYAHLIKYAAIRIFQYLPKGAVEFDDLISYGTFGLIDAINRYDNEKNDRFELYANLRIRGSILDGLRRMDWAPQAMRRRTKKIEKSYQELEQKLGRTATDAEAADYLGIEIEELNSRLQEMDYMSLVSFDQPLYDDSGSQHTFADYLEDDRNPEPGENIEKEEMKKYLTEAIERLNEKERLVVTLYYYEELTIKEISRILELTEGRISQIHKKAVLKIKAFLKAVYKY